MNTYIQHEKGASDIKSWNFMAFLLFSWLHEVLRYAGGHNRNVQVGRPHFTLKGCGFKFKIEPNETH